MDLAHLELYARLFVWFVTGLAGIAFDEAGSLFGGSVPQIGLVVAGSLGLLWVISKLIKILMISGLMTLVAAVAFKATQA
jgi:hypothetical protein